MNVFSLILLGIMSMLVLLIPSPILGFEENTSYFLDDNEFISIAIDVDSSGNASFEEVFVTLEDGTLFIMNKENIKTERISPDHSYGKFFGKTSDNDSILVIYKIVDGGVDLFAKVWIVDEKIRIVTNGEIIQF